MERLTSLAGLLILLALAWILSEKRSRIAWPGIAGAVVLMLALGAAVFLAPQSTEFFLVLNRVVLRLLRLSRDGAVYLFGPLALAPGESMVDEGTTNRRDIRVPESQAHVEVPLLNALIGVRENLIQQVPVDHELLPVSRCE